MGSQIIQGQWSLNESASSIYGITRGLLQAATSDNVQPLAILACEQFGNTLAISQETRLKIERTVLPTPEPVSLQFLKVKIGFLKHDCAVHLGSNQAGLRFLALAAALISSLSPFKCAQALASMLESTTTKKQYLPTTKHLTDLMSSLEGRCRLAGFADVVYGYRSIITGVARTKGLSVYEGDPQVPDVKGLKALVDTFREMQRVGEHNIESVVVEACSSAAWIAAFSRWALETPPSVYLADGTPVAPQPASKVTVIVIESYNLEGESLPFERRVRENAIKVIKRFKIESFQDLITESSCFSGFSYRITFETYSAQIQDILGLHEWAKKAIFAAVPLAIRLVLEKIQLPVLDLGKRCTATNPSAFPNMEKIFKTMSLVLKLPPDFPSEMLTSAKSFRDLQEVESYFDYASKLRKRDPIFSYPTTNASIRRLDRGHSYRLDEVSKLQWWAKDNSTQSRGRIFLDGMPYNNSSSAPMPTPQSMYEFIHTLSFICHIILLLSLFDNLTNVLLVPPRYYWFNCARETAVFNETKAILFGQPFGNIDASKVFPAVCQVLLQEGPRATAVIVKSGQSDCFWFSALNNPLLSTCGYLSVSYCRGRIIHERDLYNEIYDQPRDSSYDDYPSVKEYTLQSATHLPFSKFQLQWQMNIEQSRIFAGLLVSNGEDIEKFYRSYPSLIALDMLADVLVMDCEHAAESSLDPSKVKQELRPVTKLSVDASIDPRRSTKPTIYPMGGNRGLQIYCLGLIGASRPSRSLTPHRDIILRQNACFYCCTVGMADSTLVFN
ncbi:hypothetical protein F4782DRAFT_525758 [Xylaria castorea]|nr:hypothetical protein F4782DRAFT_525758 [Xylaria castorea]